MAINLQLRTGHPQSENGFIDWQFTKADGGVVSLDFIGRHASLQPGEWNTFVEVVEQRSPASWRSDRAIPQLAGNPPARELLRGCQDTPSYQLLLAGVDVVYSFRITGQRPTGDLLGDFETREHTIRSAFGSGGIYFVPHGLLTNEAEGTIAELLSHNKLGRADLTIVEEANPNSSTRYYIPYAVPITLTRELSSAANRLWDTVRTEFYTFRHPLPNQPE